MQALRPYAQLPTMAPLEFLAAATGALCVPAHLAVLLLDGPLFLAVGTGTRRRMVAVPIGPTHGWPLFLFNITSTSKRRINALTGC